MAYIGSELENALRSEPVARSDKTSILQKNGLTLTRSERSASERLLPYHVNHRCKRLLWIGRDRTSATFTTFFDWLGEPGSKAIEFIVSDMWKAFLGTAAKRASAAVHVLDRFHVAKLFSKAIDETRRSEARVLRERGDQVTLKKTRWVLLKSKRRLTTTFNLSPAKP